MLKWVFGADTSPYKKGLSEMREQTQSLASGLKGKLLSALSLGAIAAGFKKFFDEMVRVQQLAKRFNETAETIQRLGYVAERTGSDIEDLAGGLASVTEKAFDAVAEGGEAAEMFSILGINAAEFIELNAEQKMLALAKAMDESASHAENLSVMMKIMGGDGEKLIPALVQGFEKLEEQMGDVKVVGQAQVDAIEKASDAIAKLKNLITAFFGSVVGGVQLILTTYKSVMSTLYQVSRTTFVGLAEQAILAGQAIAKALVLDLSGAKKSFADMKKSASQTFAEMLAETKNEVKKLGDSYKDILSPVRMFKKGGMNSMSQALKELKEQEEQQKKMEVIAKKKAKLAEDVAKLEQEARLRALTDEQKLVELAEKKVELTKQIGVANQEGDEVKSLELQKEALQLQKEIESVANEIAEKQIDLQEKKRDLQLEVAEMEKEYELEKLTNASKLLELEKQRKELSEQANSDTIAGLEAQKKLIETNKQIDAVKKDQSEKRKKLKEDLEDVAKEAPSLVTSSLAAAGGGGPAAMFGQEAIEKKKVDLLSEIRDLLRLGKEGAPDAPIEPAA